MFERKHRKTIGRRLADLRGPGLPVDLVFYALFLGLMLGVIYARRSQP